MVDHLVMKLRMVRFPAYRNMMNCSPATRFGHGIHRRMAVDGRTLVTKNSFRFLNTLYTMGPSPERTYILWSETAAELQEIRR
ncbi:pyruvate formate-lyase [Klebsiella pneumoniae]|uniref:Pyruvate formate-lyase n=1 Tax=Klebsiella pneumoniae TaxID=573 RepID=A0A378AI34_KLEPN|nr:pyruvate formate-lyase [Klebsiella pneumoniae]